MTDMKKILFLTGTRADYGKLKPLMAALEADPNFDLYVFVCGMHLSEIHGSTYREILKDGYKNIYITYGISESGSHSAALGDTIRNLSGYTEAVKPDLIVVHGDRMDALAGAVVGVMQNILVAHIEGGELSGTMDESIRHAISKFAHLHFVCNEEAKKRLLQMGEEEQRIHVIGSPDIDVMMSDRLPDMAEVRTRYDIPFDRFGIVMYHPVTTEYDKTGSNIRSVVEALTRSGRDHVVIYPNNDLGSEIIIDEYRRLEDDPHFRVFPSVRFEYFLTMLRNAEYIFGNSSAGIREAGVYGIPAIDIGSRQHGRYRIEEGSNIIHVMENVDEILDAMERSQYHRKTIASFGDGNSSGRFVEILSDNTIWRTNYQKHFVDIDM